MPDTTQHLVGWRSLLYVPANRQKFVDSAARRGADAIILDLEDSVPAANKEEARGGLPAVVDSLKDCPAELLVRVNRDWGQLLRDLEAAVCEAVGAINLPKVDDPGMVRAVGEMLTEIEISKGIEPGHTKLFVRIESARGVRRVDQILEASSRVVATAIGTGDLSIEAGLAPDGPGIEHAHLQVSLAARAAGKAALGLAGLIVDYSDMDAFRQLALRSKALGSIGAPCIHPSQVPVLNEVFALSEREIEDARAIVTAFETAAADNRGSLVHDGQFIDNANYQEALRLLQRVDADRQTDQATTS